MSARAYINLQALRYNLRRVGELAPQSRVIPVIKANAYGHGMLEVAAALNKITTFAVATLEEAMLLRQAGNTKNIMVLQGVSGKKEWLQAAQEGISPVLHHEEQVALLESIDLPAAMDIWIKIDTGMHRLGFSPEHTQAIYRRCQQSGNELNIRFMSHFANADDADDDLTDTQLQRFLDVTKEYAAERSMANSAGICVFADSHLDWVRPGIMLYGVNPMLSGTASDFSLQPVMTLTSTLLSVHQRCRGDAIGYGGAWVCPHDMPVGIVAIGYGDGYPRHARSGTPVLINGNRVPLIGRVSMDMICVDLSQCPDAAVGDEAILWGDGLPIEEVADSADTIAYELLCKLTKRVKFVYS